MRGRFDDFAGRRFGRLVAIERAPNDVKGRTRWKCVCDCGAITTPMAAHLKRGTTQSCGCMKRELDSEKYTTHGKSCSRLYSVWANMKDRCENKNNHAYESYGGRGIKVCDEWQDFRNFLEWSLTNGYKEAASRGKCTLDRRENDRGYEPSNCHWVTMKEQGNNRRTNHMLTFNGKTMSLAQWAEELNISKSTLCNRIARGWALSDALTVPVDGRRGVDSVGKS